MTGPTTRQSNHGVIYNHREQTCQMPEVLECRAPEARAVAPRDQFVRISPEAIAAASSGTSASLAQRLTQSFNPLRVALLPLSLTGCAGDITEATGPRADPIANINALSDEETVNEQPITGKLRQVSLGMNQDSNSTIAWSVSDSFDPDSHGTFSVLGNGETLLNQNKVADSETSIPRDTSAARLDNGESIVVFSRIQGDDAPSALIGQRLDESGNPVGEEIEIIPSSIRTGFPMGKVIPLSDGFMVVFKDGEGGLGSAEFDSNGTEVSRQSLGEIPLDFQITRGEGNSWALAEITSGESIRVRSFEGNDPGGVDQNISTATMPTGPQVSIGMQEDGSMMIAWNILMEGDNPALQGVHLGTDGTPTNAPVILTNLETVAEEHINSHQIATDHRGNFILAFDVDRSIAAYVYRGASRDTQTLSEVSASSIPDSGPYAEALAGLNNVAVQNVDVQVEVSPDGLLSFVYTKIYTGEDPVDPELTTTVERIVRHDFQIDYQ